LYAWYVVGVLLIAYVLSFLDRQILSLLVEPIKTDLALNDTQVSLLQGFAFAICNGVGGLPLGRLVDTRRRVTIISVGIAFWSVMTALCGVASRFWSLFLCRMGVGVGEASLTPAAYSIISDAIAPKRIGLALGVFSVGVHIGSGLALLLGASVIGYLLHFAPIGALRPWQAVFLVVGLPGLLVSLWAATLREPARQGVVGASAPALATVLSYLRSNVHALGSVYLCMAFAAMTSYSANAWMVSMLIRTFGSTTAEAGHSYGLVVITFGAAGVVAGGLLGDAASARGWVSGRLLVMACASAAAVPFAAAAPFAGSPAGVLMLLGPMIFFGTVVIGLGPSTLQELVPNQMRGTATSIGVLVVNLIGLGLGPTAVALVTDYVLHDEHQLRHSLGALLPSMLVVSSVFGYAGLGHYRRSRLTLMHAGPAVDLPGQPQYTQ
jgi:predicted MFS family arabinose efflux permease